ncbi:MAG: glycoside hydrolase family 20 zincin-like fold domain-containing protein [Armatimonadota bacterium]|nr:glycoside hydrolase family 20 zincin-like fold domain-containing protein [Armatimonadota bacterium]
MYSRVCLLTLAAVLVCAAQCAPLTKKNISQQEALQWVRYTVPLPKSIKISGQIIVPRGAVRIVPSPGQSVLLKQAAKELADAFGGNAPSSKAAFTVRFQLGGAEADALKKLKNSDQAYKITTFLKKAGELRLIALTPNGLYYAAKTLQQLVRGRSTPSSIRIPVLEVTDWPDMAQRGLWGADNYEHLKWLGDRKMNIMEQISAIGVDAQGKPFAAVRPDRMPLVTEAPLYGIEFAPVILHLEQVGRLGVFEHYPEFKGKTEHPGALCYSQPGVADMIAEWMVQLASVPGVKTLDCWLTENMHGQPGCQCDKCKNEKWQLLEVRTVLKAWEKAKQKLGRYFTLRVTTSEATEPENKAIFAELPPDVQVTYYHSLLTYNNRRMQIIPSYVVEEAKKGRWMGVIPNFCSHTGYWEPFTGASFVHYRLNEFVDKGLKILVGYVTPGVNYYRFNTEAAAEWSWNAKGRSPREFAISYAVRYDIKNPEKFADWCEVIGEVAWDVYGSHWLYGEKTGHPGKAADLLKKGELPELGSVLWDAFPAPWGNIKDEARLNADVQAAAKALKLAKELGYQLAVEESLVVDGTIRALKALYELRKIVRPTGIAPEHKPAAERLFREYIAGLKQARDVLPRWEKMVRNPNWPTTYEDRVTEILDGMISEMKNTAAELGVNL